MKRKLLEMSPNASENEKLYSKIVPVSMKDLYTNQSRTTYLFLNIEWQAAPAGMYNRKVLYISLTDDNDPFFLYNLQLSEEDFQQLKKDQHLLIHFSSFPQHMIGYFDKCLNEEKNPQPKFLLVFTRSDNPTNVAVPSQLDIIETNDFKNIEHLTLKLISATDTAVRQYINSTFRILKEDKRQLNNRLSFLEQDLKDKLTNCQHTLNSKIQELELVRKELNVELTMKDSKHQMELQEEKDKLVSKHKDEVNRLTVEIKEKEHNFRKEIQQLESRLHVLDTLNKELQDKNFKEESTIRDLKAKVYSLESEAKKLKENLQSYKSKCDKYHSDARDRESHIHQQQEVINDLQQEIKSKEQSVLKLKDRIESEIELKKSVENQLEEVKFRLDMSEKQRQVLENETEKLNKVIIDLQDKLKEASKEEKNKSHLVAKYKKTIEEKEKALLDMKYKIGELNISLQTKNAEIKSLTDSYNTLQKELETERINVRDKENALHERISVIKWLNRQMTENNIVPHYVPPPHLTTSPSALAQKQLAKISSQSPENFPHVTAGKNTATKSVRIETASPVCRRNSSSPSQLHRTPGTDSAYCTASLHSNHTTTKIVAGSHDVNFDPENFDVDQEALSAAFGNEGRILKHSTAKKPAKSNTLKSSKRR